MTNKEQAHLNKLSQLGCCLCRKLGYGETPAEIHHLREGVGMAQRQSHFIAIPLCAHHHRLSKGAIHGDRSDFKMAKEDELSLLAWCLEEIA